MIGGWSATGALTSGDTLYLATVARDASDRLRLIKSRSCEIVLRGRDQLSLKTFTTVLFEFLQSRCIGNLAYVGSPGAGPHMGAVGGYKVEAVLQLMPCTVTLVHPGALTALIKRSDVSAPGPDRARLTGQAAKLQARAIYAAIYEPLTRNKVAGGSADGIARQLEGLCL